MDGRRFRAAVKSYGRRSRIYSVQNAGPWAHKFMDMKQALEALLGRGVDVVDWRGIEQSTNAYRRNHILKHARSFYVA